MLCRQRRQIILLRLPLYKFIINCTQVRNQHFFDIEYVLNQGFAWVWQPFYLDIIVSLPLLSTISGPTLPLFRPISLKIHLQNLLLVLRWLSLTQLQNLKNLLRILTRIPRHHSFNCIRILRIPTLPHLIQNRNRLFDLLPYLQSQQQVNSLNLKFLFYFHDGVLYYLDIYFFTVHILL